MLLRNLCAAVAGALAALPAQVLAQAPAVVYPAIQAAGTNGASDPSISSDGRFIIFTTGAKQLVPGSENAGSNAYVVSVPPPAAAPAPRGLSPLPRRAISGGGVRRRSACAMCTRPRRAVPGCG